MPRRMPRRMSVRPASLRTIMLAAGYAPAEIVSVWWEHDLHGASRTWALISEWIRVAIVSIRYDKMDRTKVPFQLDLPRKAREVPLQRAKSIPVHSKPEWI
jgi:hypothetical protein